jgi:hypothetical protein
VTTVAALVASVLAVTALTLAAPMAPVAAAETPSQIEAATESDGVYIAPGRRFDVDGLEAVVDDARFEGLRLVVVAPRDPQPSAEAFARRVQEAIEADAVIVFPPEGLVQAYTVDDLDSARVRALGAAREVDDPVQAVETFVTELTTTPEVGTPPIAGQLVTILMVCAVIVVAIVVIERLLAAAARKRRTAAQSGSQHADSA